MLSSAVRWGKRLNCWKTIPTWRRSSSGFPRSSLGHGAGPYSVPRIRNDPESGCSSRLIVRSKVDFPDPEGPKTTTCSPA